MLRCQVLWKKKKKKKKKKDNIWNMYIHEKLEVTSIEGEWAKIVGALHIEQWLH